MRGRLARGGADETNRRFRAHMLGALAAKGLCRKEELIVLREAEELTIEARDAPLTLSDEQRRAVDHMKNEMRSLRRPCLLHGITGSGKTYVYIELAKDALSAGKGVIILVPEISLTPQTTGASREALGPVMSVIHSRMSEGERRDSLEELVTGRKARCRRRSKRHTRSHGKHSDSII